MPFFQKKPVVIEARRWVGNNWNEMLAFMRYAGVKLDERERRIRVPTMEGAIYAAEGDWIIKGIQGEFYPCKPDIFDQTYEPTQKVPNTGLRQEGAGGDRVASKP